MPWTVKGCPLPLPVARLPAGDREAPGGALPRPGVPRPRRAAAPDGRRHRWPRPRAAHAPRTRPAREGVRRPACWHRGGGHRPRADGERRHPRRVTRDAGGGVRLPLITGW